VGRQRRRALIWAAAAVVLAAVIATAAPARERPAQLGRMAAAGAARLAAAHTSVIHAEGLRPGQSVSGTVALANVGDTPGRLALLRTRLADVPGPFGGLLSNALVLRVEQLGGGEWTGPLAGPDALDLGVMEPGEGRTYRLTLTFPDTGQHGRDNAYQGSSVTIDWAWATEAIAPTPTATSTSTPTAAPPPPPAKPVTLGAPRLDLRIPHQRVLGARGITMFGTCDRACRITFRASIRRAPRAHAASKALMRRRIFRSNGTARRLPGGGERRIALKLTTRAVRTLKRELHVRARVVVVIKARVRGAGGARTVTRRIVLKRAARTHNVTGGGRSR
jgi:ribosomal protein L28